MNPLSSSPPSTDLVSKHADKAENGSRMISSSISETCVNVLLVKSCSYTLFDCCCVCAVPPCVFLFSLRAVTRRYEERRGALTYSGRLNDASTLCA
jgi:hypothetical protein